jgi:tRNA/rRNA methyltransferase
LNLYKINSVKKKKTKKKELLIFFKVLQNYLEKVNFFKVKEKKKIMMRNIKAIFNKAELTEKEVKILLGIIKNLTK